MTNRIVEFETRFQKRRADIIEREMKGQTGLEPTQWPPHLPANRRPEHEKREPAWTDRSPLAE